MTTLLALEIAGAVLLVVVPIAFVMLKRRHTIMKFHEQE